MKFDKKTLFFSDSVISDLLKVTDVIPEQIVENITHLEKHWRSVDFELKFEITERCNLKCSFCHQEFGKRINHKADFELEDYKNIIDEAKQEKQIKYVRITGGEPLLHPNVKDFLQYATDAGYCTILNTNATLLTAELISSIAPFVGIWKISLPSYEDQKTNAITGVPDVWSKKINALQILKEHNCVIDLLVVLTRSNIPHISDFITVAKKYNATCSFLRQESNATERLPLAVADVEEMVHQLEQNKTQVGLAIPFCASTTPERLAAVAGGRIDCGPYSSLVISKKGKVHSCYSRRRIYDIKGGILKTAMRIAAEDFVSLPSICQKCRFGAVCLGGCRCGLTLKNSIAGLVDYLADFNSISTHINNTEGDLL